MRPVVRTAAVVAVVVIVGVGGFAAGWFLKPASGSSGSSSEPLWIIAAGSLAPILPAFASTFANQTPGVSDPISAQLYEGSGTAATSLAGGQQPYDVFVAADFRTIPSDLEPTASTVASWEVVFAADPMVLAYAPSDSALGGINATNWPAKLMQAGVLLGAPNASTDPLGYNAIFTLELEDAAAGLNGSLYAHFFHGAEGSLATPTSATVQISENVAATALSSGEADAFLLYRSYAIADHLTYLDLGSAVDLSATGSANVSHYQTATTTVLSGTSTKLVKGAPVLFSVTVPSTATSELLGVAFTAFLLSNASQATWAGYGFDPLPVEWSDHPSALPAALAGSPPSGVQALPGYLVALL